MKKSQVGAAAILLFVSALTVCAQAQPNLENGISLGASYDGSGVDAANLMNCNLTLHIPLPIDVPQRAKLGIKYYTNILWRIW